MVDTCDNDEKPQTGLILRSQKRSFQGVRSSLRGSLKKSFKKTKLDDLIESKSTEIVFKYGNYNRYYGYRNENKEDDKRLYVLEKKWFENKRCLDIGSNVGHISLWIGKYFFPEIIKGIDIDCELVKAARKNIVHYIDENSVSTFDENINEGGLVDFNEMPGIVENVGEGKGNILEGSKEGSEETLSNLEVDVESDEKKMVDKKVPEGKRTDIFPYNVSFILENYVPASSNILKHVKEDFHVILCLSVTKWVQLNFGDEGLKLMFRKIYKQLYPCGMLILEPQPYKSYKRRKNLTPAIRKNYDAMKLMPSQFIDYLLSTEVGFVKCEQIEVTKHEKEGFQRPMYLLTK